MPLAADGDHRASPAGCWIHNLKDNDTMEEKKTLHALSGGESPPKEVGKGLNLGEGLTPATGGLIFVPVPGTSVEDKVIDLADAVDVEVHAPDSVSTVDIKNDDGMGRDLNYVPWLTRCAQKDLLDDVERVIRTDEEFLAHLRRTLYQDLRDNLDLLYNILSVSEFSERNEAVRLVEEMASWIERLGEVGATAGCHELYWPGLASLLPDGNLGRVDTTPGKDNSYSPLQHMQLILDRLNPLLWSAGLCLTRPMPGKLSDHEICVLTLEAQQSVVGTIALHGVPPEDSVS